jgi:hypothetical protein
MQITGDGITQFQFKVMPAYRVLTQLAIKWVQVSSGNWRATDRGAGEDVYEADISMRGTESIINNVIDQIQNNRLAGSGTPNQITMSGFLGSEHIFGENVDHSGSINAVIMSMEKRQQAAWKSYLLSMRVRALIPTFTGSSSFPTLEWCDVGAEHDADMTIRKNSTYDGTMIYQDHRSDSGIFDGVFTLSNANFILLRNNIRTQRTGDFTLSNTFGVAYPFGKRSANAYPLTCKLIEWQDLGWFGLKYNRIRLRFAEAV